MSKLLSFIGLEKIFLQSLSLQEVHSQKLMWGHYQHSMLWIDPYQSWKDRLWSFGPYSCQKLDGIRFPNVTLGTKNDFWLDMCATRAWTNCCPELMLNNLSIWIWYSRIGTQVLLNFICVTVTFDGLIW